MATQKANYDARLLKAKTKQDEHQASLLKKYEEKIASKTNPKQKWLDNQKKGLEKRQAKSKANYEK